VPIDPAAFSYDWGEWTERSWTSKDALLYALGVGAGGIDPTAKELELTTENSRGIPQKVLPTFAVIIGAAGGRRAGLGGVNRAMVVDGGRTVILHRQIPVEGRVRARSRVTGVYDKGSGAVVASESEAFDADSGELLFGLRSQLFVRGEGGFGGERGPSGPRNVPPEREPDHVVTYQTRPDQALLYRLSGDRNPLHSDPAFAKAAGFPKPILHGLCTYGFTGRALLHTLCGSDPARFSSMEGRFSKPVFPGDSLTVKMWVEGSQAVFQTETQRGEVVIDQGLCTFS
jgi:acyl dehydratase